MIKAAAMIRCISIFFFAAYVGFSYSQNNRSLEYYIQVSGSYSPELKENRNLQQLNLLQKSIIKAQLRKPQINFTAEYLFAPYFFNNGQLISITSNPSAKAFGYDAGITNGGLYAAQFNVFYSVFNGNIYNTFSEQIDLQNKLLLSNNGQILHNLNNHVITQYILTNQLQQQIQYLKNIITLVNERKTIVQSLVEQGIMQREDYLLLEIEISNRQFDIEQQKAALCDAVTRLNNLCGINDTTLYVLVPAEIKLTEPLKRYVFEQKYTLDSADIAVQQEVLNTKYKPQLQLFGNAGLNATEAGKIPHNSGISAGLHFAIPIYDGRQKKITEQQSKLMQQSLQFFHSDNEIQLKNNLNSLLQQIKSVKTSIIFIDNQLDTQDQLLQLIKDKVIAGQVSVTDYLNVVKDFASSNQNRIQAQTQLLLLVNQYNYLNW